MSFFIDILLVAVFVIAVITGWRRGLVRSLMHLISLAGAVVITWLTFNPVAQFISDKFMTGRVADYINGIFQHDVGSTGKSLSDLFAEMPEFFSNFINRFSSTPEATSFYEKNANATSDQLSRFMAEPIATTISKVIAIVVIFFLSYLVLKLLTRLLDRVVKIPILNGLNHGLGLFLGAAIGIALAWVLAIAFNAAAPKLAALYPNVFKENTMETTIIAKNLYEFNLFKIIDLFKF